MREALDISADELAVRMTAAAAQLRLGENYDKFKISKIETGARDLSHEDIAVLDRVDPRHPGYFWWAFGREEPLPAGAVEGGSELTPDTEALLPSGAKRERALKMPRKKKPR